MVHSEAYPPWEQRGVPTMGAEGCTHQGMRGVLTRVWEIPTHQGVPYLPTVVYPGCDRCTYGGIPRVWQVYIPWWV